MGIPEGAYADIGGGLRVHYHEAGPRDGQAVVFLHGSGPGASGWSNFKGNLGYFGEHGLRALAPDTLGFGYSSRGEELDYSWQLVCDGVGRFMDAVGVRDVVLVGNSLGGAMAIQLALDHPDRVRKLILMAPGGLESREVYMEMRGIKRMVRAVYDPAGLSLESMRKVFELQLHRPEDIDPAVLEERFEVARTQPVKRVMEAVRVPQLAGRLAELRCPVFAFWGMNDQFCPVSGAQKIAESVKNVRVLQVSQCGHWVMVEYPALFNRLSVDFISNG